MCLSSVCVCDYHTITSISSLLCSAAVLPVSPASSEPTSCATSSPNPVETALVTTSGRYQWDMCTGLMCIIDVIEDRLVTVCQVSDSIVAVYKGMVTVSPSTTADSSGSERRDPHYKRACSL